MKLPKKFNQMSVKDQEKYLVQRLQANEVEGDAIRRLLAQVRGGKKVELVTEERPDESVLKD